MSEEQPPKLYANKPKKGTIPILHFFEIYSQFRHCKNLSASNHPLQFLGVLVSNQIDDQSAFFFVRFSVRKQPRLSNCKNRSKSETFLLHRRHQHRRTWDLFLPRRRRSLRRNRLQGGISFYGPCF